MEQLPDGFDDPSAHQHQPQQHEPPAFLQLCPICDKRFTRERAFSRHVSYCRRAQATRKARPKSCFACHASKRKCSFSQPRCTRCETKGLECVYDKPGRYKWNTASAGTATPADAPQPAPQSQPGGAHPLVVSDQELAAWVDNVTFSDQLEDGDANVTQDPAAIEPRATESKGVVCLPGGFWLWDIETATVQPNSMRQNGNWVPSLPFTSTSSPQSDPSTDQDHSSPPRSVTTLTHLRHGNPATKLAARLASDLICAFPQMMLRRNTFPPFIHGYWHRPALPEALSNCMSIAQLFVNRTPQSRPFLWRTIDAEMQRFRDEARVYSPYDIQPAAQSILIYTIMAIIDRDHETPSRGARLIETFGMLSMVFLDTTGDELFSYTEQAMPSSTWDDWVFAEERRRISCLWFVMSHIISGYEIPCRGSDIIDNLPLISSKSLWEARNLEEWASEKAFYEMGRPITTFGELINARRNPEDPSNAARLQNWEAGSDKLGMLLNVATSFA